MLLDFKRFGRVGGESPAAFKRNEAAEEELTTRPTLSQFSDYVLHGKIYNRRLLMLKNGERVGRSLH